MKTIMPCAAMLLAFSACAMDPAPRGQKSTAADAQSGREVQLDSLDLALVSSGWGTAQAGKDVAGKDPIALGGQVFAHGVGVHVPSVGTVMLGRRATRFRATVGVQDGQPAMAEFLVYGDGKLLQKTGPVRSGSKPVTLDVDVAGIKRLKLEVAPVGSVDYGHANWAGAVILCAGPAPEMVDPAANSPKLYPPADRLIASPGDTAYFVDPAGGDDANSGEKSGQAWKSLAKINALKLAPGDKVVIAPGLHEETLKPSGAGTPEKPIIIAFQPGVHTFAEEDAFRQPMFVSNSCDAPRVPKPIGILVQNVRHLRLQGGGVDGPGKTEILYAGRMVEIFNDHSEDIAYSGLAFDLKRPTVSEFRVLETTENGAVIQVAEGSTYAIKDGTFAWTGDTGKGWVMAQQANPEEGRAWRIGQWNPFASAKAEALGDGKVRLSYAKGAYGMAKGRQFQFRPTVRDSVGVHNARSKDIAIRDCDFYALTNMGFVSQFTENITYQRVNVAPPKGTIRTCPAWGDIFQFSNCRGDILVDSCRLSGMQDDAINCHGTHLRIIGKTADNQLLLRFMHPQTYGFAAYEPGDEIAVIQHGTLREYDGNPRRKVTAIIPKPGDTTGKDWLLTLDGPVPAFNANDAVDNITWYPNLTATGNHVSMDPVRGFLLTTRGRVLVEGNTFHRCAMPAILLEDDAEGWFESGPVRDMTIRNNRFIGCGVAIGPHTSSRKPEEWVHENILIENNFFSGAGVGAQNVKGLTIAGNRSPGGSIGVNIGASCSDVKVENNALKSKE